MREILLIPPYDLLKKTLIAYVDDADFDWLSKYNWSYYKGTRGGFYATTHVNGKLIKMHHLVLEPKDGYIVDHKNGNTLDNQRLNLRYADNFQSAWNMKKRNYGTSTHKGVSYNQQNRNYRARIYHHGVKHELGSFLTEIEAAHAYDKAAIKYFGEFAKLNFPKKD